jgi:P pilus assembly chaperone PapD
MTHKRFAQKTKNWFWILLFVAYAALAAGVVIETTRPEFRGLTQVSVVSVSSPEESRSKSASQVAAVYRATSGVPFSSLPPGSTFKIVWPDGSSEEIVVGSPLSSIAARPLQGTQRSPAE